MPLTCPITDDLIPTGLEVGDLDTLPAGNLLTACPVCGRDHEWTPADAVLAVAPAAGEPTCRSGRIAMRSHHLLERPW